QLGEFTVIEKSTAAIASQGMHPKEGRPGSLGLNVDHRGPGALGSFISQKTGKLLDGGRAKERGKWKLFLEHALDLGKQLHSEKRMSSEIEEIIGDADRLHTENFFPDFRQLLLGAVARRDKG